MEVFLEIVCLQGYFFENIKEIQQLRLLKYTGLLKVNNINSRLKFFKQIEVLVITLKGSCKNTIAYLPVVSS